MANNEKDLPRSDGEFGLKITEILDWAYDLVLDGVSGVAPSVYELADSYRNAGGSLSDQANSLIGWQVAKASASGFITGLGGLATLPVSVPANIASVLYIQIRMIAGIAYLAGYDLRDDRVKTLIFLCLVSKGPADVMKEFSKAVGTRLALQAIRNVPGRVLVQLNKTVGFRLATKFGEKGLINLGKMVPLAGGIVGGAFDGIFTRIVGGVARNTFCGPDRIILES